MTEFDWRKANLRIQERQPPAVARRRSPPTAAQLRYIERLVDDLGIPAPVVTSKREASNQLDRLLKLRRRQTDR